MSSSKPNKDLGQHWLYDTASLEAVADAADVGEGDVVLEIGPGLGTLTEVILQRGAQVVAVEFDEQLALQLAQRAEEESWAVDVLQGDIRTFDFNQLPSNYKVAGNIPYYLTSHIVQLLLESEIKPSHIGLLVQKEVAERIAAQAGEMSVLSVTSQYYADVELGPVVKKELFQPPPKVDSQIVSLTPKSEVIGDPKAFFQIVKAGFGERRKKLSNSLAGGLQKDKQDTAALIKDLGWSDNTRAQELDIEQWHQLFQAIKQKGW